MSNESAKAVPPTWYWLALSWPVAIGIALGPYLALWHYFWPLEAWVHGAYWVGMVIYIALAGMETIHVDTDELGWFGGLMDNPFSYQDDVNRMKLLAAILMLPGQLVAWTLVGTWRRLRGGLNHVEFIKEVPRQNLWVKFIQSFRAN